MKFSNIVIKNFRQYYNTVSLDLSTNQDKNIIVIGGRNGYGKTNLLLAIVWCLYGDRLSQVDDNFKKEIQKEKNYSSFMQQSLNWTAKKENKDTFSVSIVITGIELPGIDKLGPESGDIRITRSFNVTNMHESFSISVLESNIEIFDEEPDKVNFINDYVIPIEAGKFVFFDAEKISEIANLSLKEEGDFINDALSKVLGLDIYTSLVDDFNFYINTLKKEGATKNLQEQIFDRENNINLSNIEIEELEEENADLQKKIDNLKKEIRDYNGVISQHSKQSGSSFDRGSVVAEIDNLKVKEQELAEKFRELSEVIPLAILAGKLEEVNEHLRVQEKNEAYRGSFAENMEKIEDFIESLFNKPPDPSHTTMSFKDKLFYYEKAQKLATKLFSSEESFEELCFEHDLNNAEKNLIIDAVSLVHSQSKDLFQTTIEQFNEVRNKLDQLNKTLSKVDADLEDELILDYSSKKEIAEYSISENNRKIGKNEQKITKLKEGVVRLQKELNGLVKRVDINAKNKRKIRESQKYTDVLKTFIEEQKKNHKQTLEINILNELKLLMHKLSSKDNNSKFIEDVKVTILASGHGMKVTLLDQDDNEIRKESLSSGEKQIYISCLIKAILNEAIQSFPIFIDTPLGRLDEEHRDSITKKYYPRLSEQVVLFSTNSEITPKRYKEIKENIFTSYLLVNDGTNSNLEPGYFQGYEN